MTISEKIQHSTIRIQTNLLTVGVSTGTGFFFNFTIDQIGAQVPVIITNKHVIEDSYSGFIRFTIAKDGKPEYSNIRDFQINNLQDHWIFHPDPNVDLCAMPIASLLNEAKSLGDQFFYVSLHKDLLMSSDELNQLTAIEDIIMVGYPNGIWDDVNNLPIIRRGVTATHPKINYCGREEFMIDAACFPGSSGSPVFLLNEGSYSTQNEIVLGSRVKLLGVLYAGPQYIASGKIEVVNIPTKQESVVTSRIPTNLGLIIKGKKILELEAELKRVFGF